MSRSSSPAYWILGASGGVGTSLARRLAASGASLSLVGRNRERLEALGQELQAHVQVVETVDFLAVDASMDASLAHHGRLDGAVNCAGSLLLKPAHLTREEEWQAVVESNLTSAFCVVRSAGRKLRDASIVLVSSAAAGIGLPNHEGIAAAKAGVEGLARSAAATYAARGLRFNTVAPGLVRTPLTERITANEKAAQSSIAMHALGRLGEPQDISGAIAWLLSEESCWVTGQVLGVDGGLSRVRARGA